jgi:hypothetical protein
MLRGILFVIVFVFLGTNFAGSRTVRNGSAEEKTFELSKDTVYEDGFFEKAWKDTLVIRNLTGDTLDIDSIYLDSIYRWGNRQGPGDYGVEYIIGFTYSTPGAGCNLRPGSNLICSFKLLPSGLIALYFFHIEYNWFPVGDGDYPRKCKTDMKDTVICRFVLQNNGNRSLFYLVGIIDIYEECSSDNIRFIQNRTARTVNPRAKKISRIDGRVIPGKVPNSENPIKRGILYEIR